MHPIFVKKTTPILGNKSAPAKENFNPLLIKRPPLISSVGPVNNFGKGSALKTFADGLAKDLDDVDDETLEIVINNNAKNKGKSKPAATATTPEPVVTPSTPKMAIFKPPPAKVKRIITNEDQFWGFIVMLDWRDKSDGTCNPVARLNALGAEDRAQFLQFYNQFLNAMQGQLETKKFFLTFGISDPEIKKDITSHLIGRGRDFYLAVLDDSGFAEYLLGSEPREYQSLHHFVSALSA